MRSENRIIKDLTFETIVSRMKADLKNPPNKVEGSFASDNIQAVAKELLKYYDYVDFLQDQHYAETAQGEYLDKKAKEVGVFRKEPTKANGFATFEGTPGVMIPAGFRVHSDSYTYITKEIGYIEDSGQVVLPIEAEKAGKESNIPAGSIYKFDSGVGGLRKVHNDKAIENGTDLEDDDALRERTLLRMRYPGTSGNQYHYMHWAMEVEGVGRVRVFPVWDGPGTVKVSILDSNQRVANNDLIKKVKHHIDNDGDRMGEALAPIGALLTVSTAKTKNLNIQGKVLLDAGSRIRREDLAETLKVRLQEFIDQSLSYKTNRLTVAKVIDILYNIEGVMDITELTVNGANDSIALDVDEIPYVERVVLR